VVDPQTLAEHLELFDQAVHAADEHVRGLENVLLRKLDPITPAEPIGDLARGWEGLVCDFPESEGYVLISS